MICIKYKIISFDFLVTLDYSVCTYIEYHIKKAACVITKITK